MEKNDIILITMIMEHASKSQTI